MSEYLDDLQKLLYKPVRKYIPQEIYFKYKITYYRYDNMSIYNGEFTIFLIDDNEFRIWINDMLKFKADLIILSILDLTKKPLKNLL